MPPPASASTPSVHAGRLGATCRGVRGGGADFGGSAGEGATMNGAASLLHHDTASAPSAAARTRAAREHAVCVPQMQLRLMIAPAQCSS
mgnify:CR=1 FL=1